MVKTMGIDKKQIQKRRMMSYFIEAAEKVMEEDGIEGITVRKVADIAGYNSATLYNYFENLDHLLFFASMKYLREYTIALPNYIKGHKNALDKYLRIWKCFSFHAFSNPKIYNIIFFESFNSLIKDSIREYYIIFPEELVAESQDLHTMLSEQNIYHRNISILNACVKEGLIEEKYLEAINEMTLLVFQGMFFKILHQQIDYTVDEAVDKVITYIQRTLKAYGCLEL